MRFINLLVLCLLFLNVSNANELEQETSPYLKQHASNPVNWYAWNDVAFDKAKKENKPIFLSIGYSTCHWCHVMAEESFENIEIARLLNKYFVSIKVDKEEMPHIDSFYQKLHKKVIGNSGGWPLNIFMTSEKKPFFMQGYIPPKTSNGYVGLNELLPDLYYKYTHSLLNKEIKNIDRLSRSTYKKTKNSNEKISVDTLIDSINEDYDDLSGGFGISSKFPEASKINLMMDLSMLGDSKSMYEKSLETLDAMALLGLYDHIDGGFFRYTVNVDWEIPHFEKMLYTQAEMISLYSRAYSMTNRDLYKHIVEETIAMCDKRFSKNDLYFSASDAVLHGSEGKYFLFSVDEIEDALRKNKYSKEIRTSLDNAARGNFLNSESSIMVHLNFNSPQRPKGFYEFKKELSKVRNKKEYPFIDKKINTAWNALMIEGLYKASAVDKKNIKKADRHLDALREFMFDKGELYHQSLIENKPKQLGFLEDYSFMISALIASYEVTFEEDKLEFAYYLLNRAKSKFYKNGIWYASDDKLDIKADLIDAHYVSALSKMLQNILKLASLKYSREYEALAKSTLDTLSSEIQEQQASVPATASAYLMQKYKVVTLKNSKNVLLKNIKKILKIRYPYIVLKEDSNGVYLACTMKSCFAIEKKLYSVKTAIENYIFK